LRSKSKHGHLLDTPGCVLATSPVSERMIVAYLGVLTVYICEEKRGQVDEAASRSWSKSGICAESFVHCRLFDLSARKVWLMAVPEIHHLGPILAREISPSRNPPPSYDNSTTSSTSKFCFRPQEFGSPRCTISLHAVHALLGGRARQRKSPCEFFGAKDRVLELKLARDLTWESQRRCSAIVVQDEAPSIR